METPVPVWPSAAAARPAKKRPGTLAGANVALVDDNLDVPFTTHLETLLGERLGATARQQAVLQNCADLELVVIPHRQGGESAADQRRKAEAALDAIVSRLVQKE